MTAREKFCMGDMVRASERGREGFLNITVGIVVGFCREEHLVRVLRPNNKQPDRFHMDFWVVDENGPTP